MLLGVDRLKFIKHRVASCFEPVCCVCGSRCWRIVKIREDISYLDTLVVPLEKQFSSVLSVAQLFD